MPRQRTHHSRRTYVFPDDFPERLVRFKEESDLPWAEIARRLGTYPHTVKRWWKEGVRPHFRHQMALLDLADDLGLGHLFIAKLDDLSRTMRDTLLANVAFWLPGRPKFRDPPFILFSAFSMLLAQLKLGSMPTKM